MGKNPLKRGGEGCGQNLTIAFLISEMVSELKKTFNPFGQKRNVDEKSPGSLNNKNIYLFTHITPELEKANISEIFLNSETNDGNNRTKRNKLFLFHSEKI